MPDEEKEEKDMEPKADGYLISYTKHLERKIRALEAEKQLIEREKIRLDREVRSIRTELDRMRQPPLVFATVVRNMDDGRVIVKSTTGPEFFVKYSKAIDSKDLQPGVRIALNQRTFSIVEIVEGVEEESYSALRAWQGFDFKVKVIEVEEWPEITPDIEKYFYVRVKSLNDLIDIAKIYRIPALFKKSEEYIAIHYDSPLFWYKP